MYCSFVYQGMSDIQKNIYKFFTIINDISEHTMKKYLNLVSGLKFVGL